MGTNKYTVVINSDGTVVTYDHLSATMPEFSGFLPILHKIIKYLDNKSKKSLPDDLTIYDPIFKFAISGNNGKEIIIPKYHINRFVRHIKGLPDDQVDSFDKLLEFIDIKEK